MIAHQAVGREGSAAATLACAIAVLLLAGCSGGRGAGSDPVTCTNLSFDRALVAPSSGDVYLDQAAGTCSTIDIAVNVSSLSNIWSVGFDLVYPSAQLQYQSYTLGPLLKKGSPPVPPVVIVTTIGGGIQVSMTLLSGDLPVNATGSETLITLRFGRVAAGTGLIDFDASAGSTVSESILDDKGVAQPAVFGPGHGGMVVVP